MKHTINNSNTHLYNRFYWDTIVQFLIEKRKLKIKQQINFNYFFHFGSASWITDSSGSPIQHLQYLPFGERWIDQRTTNWNTRYTFSAKEKDEEREYSYFGARYYDSELSIWLSVDPMADKYPSLTPYNYCANNPIRLVDPNGMEVEFSDKISKMLINLLCSFDEDFKSKVEKLKSSDETYVFNLVYNGENNFTTNGDKLFINFSCDDKSANEGQTLFSNLKHETTHGVQFEHGELGFAKQDGKNWTAVFYDIQDEMEAHTNQNTVVQGLESEPAQGTSRAKWNNASEQERLSALQNNPKYSHLKVPACNAHITSKIKTESVYVLPHTPRKK